MTDVTVNSEVLSIGHGGDLEYGLQNNEDGEVSHYQCLNCGHHVASDVTELCNSFGLKEPDDEDYDEDD